MVINLKYEVGHELWFMKDNKCICAKVTGIGITVYLTGTSVFYTLAGGNTLSSSQLFPSKQELLNSL